MKLRVSSSGSCNSEFVMSSWFFLRLQKCYLPAMFWAECFEASSRLLPLIWHKKRNIQFSCGFCEWQALLLSSSLLNFKILIILHWNCELIYFLMRCYSQSKKSTMSMAFLNWHENLWSVTLHQIHIFMWVWFGSSGTTASMTQETGSPFWTPIMMVHLYPSQHRTPPRIPHGETDKFQYVN